MASVEGCRVYSAFFTALFKVKSVGGGFFLSLSFWSVFKNNKNCVTHAHVGFLPPVNLTQNVSVWRPNSVSFSTFLRRNCRLSVFAIRYGLVLYGFVDQKFALPPFANIFGNSSYESSKNRIIFYVVSFSLLTLSVKSVQLQFTRCMERSSSQNTVVIATNCHLNMSKPSLPSKFAVERQQSSYRLVKK